jgi:hypothetical protein
MRGASKWLAWLLEIASAPLFLIGFLAAVSV